MGYFKRLITSWSVSLEAFKMYYVMRASAPSLHRESTDSLIYIRVYVSQDQYTCTYTTDSVLRSDLLTLYIPHVTLYYLLLTKLWSKGARNEVISPTPFHFSISTYSRHRKCSDNSDNSRQ